MPDGSDYNFERPTPNAAQKRAMEAGAVFESLTPTAKFPETAEETAEEIEEVVLDKDGIDWLVTYAEDTAINNVYDFDPETLEVTYHCQPQEFVATDQYRDLTAFYGQAEAVLATIDAGEDVADKQAEEVQAALNLFDGPPTVLPEPLAEDVTEVAVDEVYDPAAAIDAIEYQGNLTDAQWAALALARSQLEAATEPVERAVIVEEIEDTVEALREAEDIEAQLAMYIGENPEVPASTKAEAYQLYDRYQAATDLAEQAQLLQELESIIALFEDDTEGVSVRVPGRMSRTLELGNLDEEDAPIPISVAKLESTASKGFDPQTPIHTTVLQRDIDDAFAIADNLRKQADGARTSEGKTQAEIDAHYRQENLNYWRNKSSELLGITPTRVKKETQLQEPVVQPKASVTTLSFTPKAVQEKSTPTKKTSALSIAELQAELAKIGVDSLEQDLSKDEAYILAQVDAIEGIKQSYFSFLTEKSPFDELAKEPYDKYLILNNSKRTALLNHLNQMGVKVEAFDAWMSRLPKKLTAATKGKTFQQVATEYILNN